MDKIKDMDMKIKFAREYKRWLKLVLKSKVNGRNKILAINIWHGIKRSLRFPFSNQVPPPH